MVREMKIKIKNRFTGNIILCGDYESIKDCLKKNRGADLRGADLRGAKGIKLPIISISGSCHTLQYISGKIKIGCENHTVEKWLKDYKKIGKNYNYTAAEIKEYGEYIKMCAKFAKGKAK